MRPTSPQLPADPTPVPLVTERMGARIAAGEGSLAFHRASGTWIAGSRRSGDKPRPPSAVETLTGLIVKRLV